jgi:two-component system sporulation sensor kinase A
MLLFNRLSIKGKLTAIMLFVSMLTLISGFTFMIILEIQSFKSDMITSTTALARVIGDYSVVALAFADKTECQRTLSRLSTVPHIEFASIYDVDGTVFASYQRLGVHSKIPPLKNSEAEFKNGYLEVFHPIIEKQNRYGTIYLRASTQPLKEKTVRLIFTMVVFMFALIGALFLLTGLVQGVISKPILRLAEITRHVSKERDYSIRVQETREDEIGILYSGFDDMLNQIEKRKEERDIAEKALRESEERYRRLVEFSPVLIFVEQDNKLAYINSAGLRLLGYNSPEELLGRSFTDLFAGDYDNSVVPTQSTLEKKFVRKDKKLVDVELTFIYTSYEGIPAIQGVALDITESKRLRQATQRMERLAALGELSAGIAHEIRNSLGSIILNFKQLSTHLELPQMSHRSFTNIELGLARIQEIIKGILDFARPAPSSLKKVSMHKVVDSSILAIEKEFEQAGIRIIRAYTEANDNVLIDYNQMIQTFLNLFLNAKQAMPEGGDLTISVDAKNHTVEVGVRDTGKGIPSEILERIFDPFFTTKSEGIGLGLAIVYKILEQHKAQIFVESNTGRGTQFTIRLPKAE